MADLPNLSIKLLNRFNVRFHTDGENGCWIWTGAVVNGYGRFCISAGKTTPAHRVLWEMKNGKVPKGYELDHKCRNKICINPSHLEAVTHAENMRRAAPFIKDKRWSHCTKGHDLSINRNKRGRCKICANILAKEAYYRKKEND